MCVAFIRYVPSLAKRAVRCVRNGMKLNGMKMNAVVIDVLVCALVPCSYVFGFIFIVSILVIGVFENYLFLHYL